MKALYRKYRPLRLTDVVGQEQVTVPLDNALKAGKVGHAYLFTGPRGTGKTSVARILAHQVNGFDYKLEDDYVDIIEIDGASNRGIDSIRELREKVAIAPTRGKYKVYIIDEVHMLTKEAFNALLKTLEEPPEHAIFILATTDAYKVPITITSRSQIYNFQLADAAVMLKHLKEIAEKEGIKITDEALQIVVKRGGGSFRDSLSLLDQVSSLTDDEITAEVIEKAMGLPEDAKISEILAEYGQADVTKMTALLRGLMAGGVKAEVVAEEMIRQIIENPRVELFGLLAKLPEVKAPFAEAKLMVALASGISNTPKTAVTSTAPRAAATPRTAETPATPAAPATQPPVVANSDGSFDWAGFLERVQRLNDAIYMQVKKSQYTLQGDELVIYPEKKIGKVILDRENNKRILVEAAEGRKVTIGEPGTNNSSAEKDVLISKISGIMGGEVKNDGGGIPF